MTLRPLPGYLATIPAEKRARSDAYELMVQHATETGANAVIAMRYDANEIQAGITEVLAYGTAVVIERVATP